MNVLGVREQNSKTVETGGCYWYSEGYTHTKAYYIKCTNRARVALAPQPKPPVYPAPGSGSSVQLNNN